MASWVELTESQLDIVRGLVEVWLEDEEQEGAVHRVAQLRKLEAALESAAAALPSVLPPSEGDST